MQSNYRKFIFSDLKKIYDNYPVKNIVITNNKNLPPDFNLDQDCIFDFLVYGIVLKGSTKIMSNFKEFELHEKSIFVILPIKIYKFYDSSDDFQMGLIFCSSDFVYRLPPLKDYDIIVSMNEHPYLKLTDEEYRRFVDYFAFLKKQYNIMDGRYVGDIIGSLAYGLIVEYNSIYKLNVHKNVTNELSKPEMLAASFFYLLNEHYREERTVAFYADKLCLTPKYLSTVIRYITGRPILSWINLLLTGRIRFMLKNTNLSIAEISDYFNFSSHSFFGRFFKQNTGMTPAEYRKMP